MEATQATAGRTRLRRQRLLGGVGGRRADRDPRRTRPRRRPSRGGLRRDRGCRARDPTPQAGSLRRPVRSSSFATPPLDAALSRQRRTPPRSRSVAHPIVRTRSRRGNGSRRQSPRGGTAITRPHGRRSRQVFSSTRTIRASSTTLPVPTPSTATATLRSTTCGARSSSSRSMRRRPRKKRTSTRSAASPAFRRRLSRWRGGTSVRTASGGSSGMT